MLETSAWNPAESRWWIQSWRIWRTSRSPGRSFLLRCLWLSLPSLRLVWGCAFPHRLKFPQELIACSITRVQQGAWYTLCGAELVPIAASYKCRCDCKCQERGRLCVQKCFTWKYSKSNLHGLQHRREPGAGLAETTLRPHSSPVAYHNRLWWHPFKQALCLELAKLSQGSRPSAFPLSILDI